MRSLRQSRELTEYESWPLEVSLGSCALRKTLLKDLGAVCRAANNGRAAESREQECIVCYAVPDKDKLDWSLDNEQTVFETEIVGIQQA